MPKSTPEQIFTKVYNLANDPAAPEHMRKVAKRKIAAWLKRHGKTQRDYPAIFAKAAADNLAQQPPPPPSDPRDNAPHPFDDPQFTPAGLVEGIVAKYVTMSPHVSVICSLWTCFTHVYTQFAIAPRIELTSEDPESGKSTTRKVLKYLVYRPNREVLGSAAALTRHLARGPGTMLLDELDRVRREAKEKLLVIWILGYERGAETSLMEGGREKYFNIYAPVLGAGIGKFLEAGTAEKGRTFTLEMEQYTEVNKPPLDYNTDLNTEELDAVYSYLRNWAQRVKLNPKPPMLAGMIRRWADNARGLLSIADACGPEWGGRAREAVAFLLAKEKSERPELTMVRHGLVIFDTLELDQIASIRFNQELKRLDLSDAKWTRYRGPSGTDYARPIEMHQQATLLGKVGIHSTKIRPPGEKQCHGYKLAQFQEAQRKYDVAAPDETEVGRARLRLVKPPSD